MTPLDAAQILAAIGAGPIIVGMMIWLINAGSDTVLARMGRVVFGVGVFFALPLLFRLVLLAWF